MSFGREEIVCPLIERFNLRSACQISPVGQQDIRGLNLVLNFIRGQTFHPDAFSQFGIDLASLKIIIPKSSQHFYAGFAPIAAEVIYATSPGTLNMDFANLPFTKLATPFWPNVEDPFKS